MKLSISWSEFELHGNLESINELARLIKENERISRGPEMDDICGSCDERFGAHTGMVCPNNKTSFKRK